MAAAQVFAIPELLENILLHVASEAVAAEEATMKAFAQNTAPREIIYAWPPQCFMQPITSFSILQRIDRTFNATIKGSPRLQQACFNDPPSMTDEILAQITPLEWLFGQLALRPYGIEYGRRLEKTLNINTVYKHKETARYALQSFHNSKARFPEASWRQVKLDGQHASDNVRIEARITFRRPPEYFGTAQHEVVLQFTGDSTLEDVYNVLAEILNRKSSEHLAKMPAELRSRLD